MAPSEGNDPGADESPIRATPELEDFRGKYETGGVGKRLLNNYFVAVQELIVVAAVNSPVTAIEIGCGEGLSTQRLKSLLPAHIELEASEYVQHQVAFARENNPGLRITHESIYELTHGNQSYDIVFLLEVLEHLDFPDRGLEEVMRILKPGGYLVAGVPREPIWRILNVLRGKYLTTLGNTPGHLQHWSKRTFVRYISINFGSVVASRSPLPWTLVLAQKGSLRWPRRSQSPTSDDTDIAQGASSHRQDQ